MDLYKSVLNNILNEFEMINTKINSSNSIDDINLIFSKIKEYDSDIKKIKKTLDAINSSKDNLKITFNNFILKKHSSISSSMKNNKISYDSDDSEYNITNIDTKESNEISNPSILSTSKILKTSKAFKSSNSSKTSKASKSSKNLKNNIGNLPTISYKNLTNDDKFKNSEYTKCPVINISNNDINSIINTPIYHILETGEYCIKINNNLFKGNIGNIFSNNENEKEFIHECKRDNCNGYFYGKKCKFLHNNNIRNFTNYSWGHIIKNKLGKPTIKNNKISKTKYDDENTRYIGSLNTLNEDLILTNNMEKKLRNSQLIHDLLIYQILANYLI